MLRQFLKDKTMTHQLSKTEAALKVWDDNTFTRKQRLALAESEHEKKIDSELTLKEWQEVLNAFHEETSSFNTKESVYRLPIDSDDLRIAVKKSIAGEFTTPIAVSYSKVADVVENILLRAFEMYGMNTDVLPYVYGYLFSRGFRFAGASSDETKQIIDDLYNSKDAIEWVEMARQQLAELDSEQIQS